MHISNTRKQKRWQLTLSHSVWPLIEEDFRIDNKIYCKGAYPLYWHLELTTVTPD